MPFIKLDNFFTECADAIRLKREKSDKILPENMANEIRSIVSKPPTQSGEYYHLVENENKSTISAYGITFYGSFLADRLKNDAQIKEVICLSDITSTPENFLYNTSLMEKVFFYGDIETFGKNSFYNSTVSEIILPNGEINKIPEKVTVIPEYCFYLCPNLSNITLHDGITDIGPYAFQLSAYGLSIGSTELPASLKTIGNASFYYQQIPLTEIPASVTSIGSQAFYQNLALNSLTFKGKPTTINSTAFSYCTNLKTINVPWAEGAVSGAPWGATNATINYNYTS